MEWHLVVADEPASVRPRGRSRALALPSWSSTPVGWVLGSLPGETAAEVLRPLLRPLLRDACLPLLDSLVRVVPFLRAASCWPRCPGRPPSPLRWAPRSAGPVAASPHLVGRLGDRPIQYHDTILLPSSPRGGPGRA